MREENESDLNNNNNNNRKSKLYKRNAEIDGKSEGLRGEEMRLTEKRSQPKPKPSVTPRKNQDSKLWSKEHTEEKDKTGSVVMVDQAIETESIKSFNDLPAELRNKYLLQRLNELQGQQKFLLSEENRPSALQNSIELMNSMLQTLIFQQQQQSNTTSYHQQPSHVNYPPLLSNTLTPVAGQNTSVSMFQRNSVGGTARNSVRRATVTKKSYLEGQDNGRDTEAANDSNYESIGNHQAKPNVSFPDLKGEDSVQTAAVNNYNRRFEDNHGADSQRYNDNDHDNDRGESEEEVQKAEDLDNLQEEDQVQELKLIHETTLRNYRIRTPDRTRMKQR